MTEAVTTPVLRAWQRSLSADHAKVVPTTPLPAFFGRCCDPQDASEPKPQDFLVITSITMKQIGFDRAFVRSDQVVPIADIWGRCDKVITSPPDAKGETVPGFQGVIYAENLQTKGLFRSSRGFFPPVLRKRLLKELEEQARILFAAQIAVMPAQGPAGYRWLGSLTVSEQ